MIHAFHVEHVQVTAQLELSQRETDSSLSMLILASLAEHAQALAQLEQSQKSNKRIKPAALSGRLQTVDKAGCETCVSQPIFLFWIRQHLINLIIA